MRQLFARRLARRAIFSLPEEVLCLCGAARRAAREGKSKKVKVKRAEPDQ
jgi:hypothetical protein